MGQHGNKIIGIKFYALSMLLYVLAVADVTWLDFLSYNSIIRLFIIIVCLVKISNESSKIKKAEAVSLLFLLLFCLYCTFVTFGSFYQAFTYLALFVAMTSIILLKPDEKQYVLEFFTDGIVLILIISLLGWFLYLLGFNLPHTGLIYHRNGYHEYYDYYFFRLNFSSSIGLFPRFSSVFLEPGQLATPCAFLFFVNAIEKGIFNFKNIVLMVAILLSFSLIGYGQLLLSLFVILLIKRYRFRLPLIIGTIILFSGITLYFIKKEDSAINVLILSRLEYDEDSFIAGNNRLSDEFDIKYDSFIHSSDRYFGIYRKLTPNNDWTSSSSGYKKFIVCFGLFGLILGGLFVFSLFWKNKNKVTIAFLISIIIAFIVRNLLFTPLWLSLTIIGFYALGDGKYLKEYQKL